MTPLDAEWFRHCHAAGLVREPFLEIGSARIAGIPNLCDEAKRLDLRNVTGADLAPGGALLVVTPAIWPLHRYPIDSCRLLPDRYETFAARAVIELLPEHF